MNVDGLLRRPNTSIVIIDIVVVRRHLGTSYGMPRRALCNAAPASRLLA